MQYDNVVDELFNKVKMELIHLIAEKPPERRVLH